MANMLTYLYLLETVAQAGGGGSSSGGSGGGSAAAVIALIGYFPSYYLGKLIKKLLPRTQELIVSGSFAAVFSILLIWLGILGGSLGVYLTVCIVVGIWGGWAAAFFGVWDRLRKRAAKTKLTVAKAAATSSAWDETVLIEHARKTFLQYQNDWSAFNLAYMKTYMTERYARHAGLLLGVLNELGRKNIVSNVEIKQLLIIDAHDDANDALDSVRVAFEAVATTQLVDTKTNAILYSSNKPFTEYWRFVRRDTRWLLDGIDQQTADASTMYSSLRQFADRNSMFYSLDMGWLLLPTGGLLMKKGRFGTSDINNHTVGIYNGRLVQLYTYTAYRSSKQSIFQLVLQITLPKSYEGIIIQPKGKFLSNTGVSVPNTYTKYTYEWPEFNKRYDVRATSADRLASFELLNPGFMAYLYDNDPGINIEVSDNTLYLYKNVSIYDQNGINDAGYQQMLTIALKAFKELKL